MIATDMKKLIAEWNQEDDPFAEVVCGLVNCEVSPQEARALRLYGAWCVRQVQERITDARLIAALDVAERFAQELATSDELSAARSAAEAAMTAARHPSNNGRPGASAAACLADAVYACCENEPAFAAGGALMHTCNALMYGDENYGGPEFWRRVKQGRWAEIEAPFRARFEAEFLSDDAHATAH